jgi:hypothetical protein
MNKNKDLLIKKLSYMISNSDIKNILGDERIIKYSDLDNYDNILELLPLEKDYFIFFVEWQPNQGHWCCVVRNKQVITYFDSYGVKPDAQILKNSKETREELEQDDNKLTYLLSTAPKNFKLVYNKSRLQTSDNEYSINSCGSWCICFVIMNLKHNYSLAKFQKWIQNMEQKTGIPRDILITDMIIPDNQKFSYY